MKQLEKLFGDYPVIMYIDESGVAHFEIESVSMAIGYVTRAKGKEYPHKTRINKTLKNAEITPVVHGVQLFMTESQLYSFLIEAHTEKSKAFQKWVTNEVLPTINKTGAYIEEGREEEMVQKYFPSFSKETQADMVNDLLTQNKKLREENSELREVYYDLMDTSDYMQMNTVAKELGIGHHKLMEFLRDHGVFFYNNDMTNIPYERFRNEGKFVVKETRCRDGAFRSVTYATRKGLDYVRKLLKKNGYDISAAVTE